MLSTYGTGRCYAQNQLIGDQQTGVDLDPRNTPAPAGDRMLHTAVQKSDCHCPQCGSLDPQTGQFASISTRDLGLRLHNKAGGLRAIQVCCIACVTADCKIKLLDAMIRRCCYTSCNCNLGIGLAFHREAALQAGRPGRLGSSKMAKLSCLVAVSRCQLRIDMPCRYMGFLSASV